MSVDVNYRMLYELKSVRAAALEDVLRKVREYIVRNSRGKDDDLVAMLIRDAIGDKA